MTLIDTSPMPFGKHKGKAMANVPAKYLLWLHGELKKQRELNDDNQAVVDYVDDNMDALKQEAK